MIYLSPEDAKTEILKYIRGEPDEFAIDKLIIDILDYCHRDDFPKALVYSVADLVNKRTEDITAAKKAPLKALQENDTRFEFAVKECSDAGLLSDEDFATLRPKMNLYRKVPR